jgi:hypothetical protein
MKKMLFLAAICLAACATMFAQGKKMYVMSGGSVAFEREVTAIDSMTFDAGVSLTAHTTTSEIFDNIRKFTFTDTGLQVTHGGTESPGDYVLDDIVKLTFGESGEGINSPRALSGVKAYYVNGAIEVESPAPVKSLTLFSMDGRCVVRNVFTTAQSETSLQIPSVPLSIYFIRVQTTEGNVTIKLTINN